MPKLVQCPQCGATYPPKDSYKHAMYQCPNRKHK